MPGAVTTARMQAVDRRAIEAFHMPRLLLMEQAGFALAGALRPQLPSPAAGVLVCCGMGYNGGDGLAAARHLAAWGLRVRVLLLGESARLREEPAVFARMLEALQVPRLEITGLPLPTRAVTWLQESAAVLDALLGIGLREAVREPAASLIRLINQAHKYVLAADLPSGLDADTGEVRGVAVQADATVAFGLIKQGCLQGEGPAHAGQLLTASIGLPHVLLEEAVHG